MMEADDSDAGPATFIKLQNRIKELFGQEYYAATVVGQEQTTIFTVPYVSFIDAMNTVEYRLLYDSKVYDIKYIDHLPGETWVKLRAIERPGADTGRGGNG